MGKDTPARPRGPRCFSRRQEPPPQPRKPDSPLQPQRAGHPSRDGPLPPTPQDGSGTPPPQNPGAQPPSRTFPGPEVTPAQPDFRLVPPPTRALIGLHRRKAANNGTNRLAAAYQTPISDWWPVAVLQIPFPLGGSAGCF